MSAGETITDNSPVINRLQTLENGEIIQANRNELGHFQPGVSGNPDGRPKSRLFSEKLKELLEKVDAADQTGADRLGDKMFKMADQDKDQWLALAAIKEIRDTTEGKPTQSMAIKGTLVMMPADAVIDAAFNGSEE